MCLIVRTLQYLSLKVTGGPKIQFHPGRIDITDESACPPIGPLQTSETHEDGVDEMGRQDGWQDLATYMRDTIFGGLGLNDQGRMKDSTDSIWVELNF